MSEHIEDSFSKLVGRQATEEERQRLYRVRDALGLANNDALWLILVALESYDTLYREYPRKLAEAATAVLEAQRASLAATVAAETATVRRTLADAVVRTSEEIAGKRASAARWQAWTLVVAALVTFGGLCIATGYMAATVGPPPWVRGSGPGGLLATAVLGAPVGLTVLGLLVPCVGYYGWTGLVAARDPGTCARDRAVGYGVTAASAAALLAGVIVVLRWLIR